MVSLLSHWVGLWIVSGKMVIELICFLIHMFWILLAFLVIVIQPLPLLIFCFFSPHVEFGLFSRIYLLPKASVYLYLKRTIHSCCDYSQGCSLC